MAKKFGTFGKNAMKSFGRTGLAVTRDLMPNLSKSVKENKDFAVTKYKEVKEKPRNSDIKTTFLYRTTKSLIDNALEDLKSGNFNNEERQKKSETESFANMFGFDPHMFDMDDDFDFSSDESYSMQESDSGSSFNLDGLNVTADFSDETKHDIKTIARMGGANLKVLNLGMVNLSVQLTNLTNFHNENTNRFYETVEEKLYELNSNLEIVSSYYKDLFENSRKDNSPNESLMAKFFNQEGINIKEWMDIRKEAKGDSSGVFSLIKDMAKSQYESLAANPLGYLSKSVMKSLIPKRLKNTMTRFDNMFGMAPMLLQGFGNSKNPFLKMFGDFFNLDKFKIKNKKYNYEKGAVPFDGVTRRAINHVIPGYLSRILTAVSNREQDKRLHYDYETGKFITHKDATKKFKAEINDSMQYSMTRKGVKNLSNEALKEAKEKGLIKNDEDLNNYSNKIDEALKNMAKKGKSFHSIKDIEEISNDKELAELLMKSYSNMSVDGKKDVVSNMGRAFVDYQTYLKENAHNDLFQQAYDFASINKITKKSEEKIKMSDLGDKVRGGINKVNSKIGDTLDKESKFKKIFDFINSEEETIVDKKLNQIYDNLLNPNIEEDNSSESSPSFVEKISKKYKTVDKILSKIDKEDLKEKIKKATPTTKPEVESKDTDLDKRTEDAINGKAEVQIGTKEVNSSKNKPIIKEINHLNKEDTLLDIQLTLNNPANNINTNISASKKDEILKVHVVGGSLDNIQTVEQVVNVDDVDEVDIPKYGSSSEQRKRLKEKEKERENNKQDLFKREDDEKESTAQPEEEEEEKKSFLSNLIDRSGIKDLFVNKLEGKVGSLLDKTKLGSKLKSGAKLLTKPKTLLGGVKNFAKGGLGKIAGLARMSGGLSGIASTAGSMLSSAGGAITAALPGLASTLGSILPAIGGLAAGAAPFLLPALAVGGAFKLGKKLFKKDKQKLDENGNPMYDDLGNPIMESTASKIGRGIKNTGKKILKFATPLGLLDSTGKFLFDKKKDKTNNRFITPVDEENTNTKKETFFSKIQEKLLGKRNLLKYGTPTGLINDKEKDEFEKTLASPGGDSFNVTGEQDDNEKTKVSIKKKVIPNLLTKHFEYSPIGMLYKLMKKDKERLLNKGNSAEEKMAKFTEPVGKWFKSGSFKKIFGSSGLFVGMRDGLLGKVGSAIGGVFKKFFGTIFDSASKNVSKASKNTGSATVGTGNTNNGSSNVEQAEVTLDSSYATGNITSVDQLINKSLKINSGITAEQIDAAIAKAKGKDSYMYGTGADFIEAGKVSGLDPLYLVAHAIEESGWGTSQIVRDKNNWFGIQAYDGSAYDSAKGFSDKKTGIIEGAKWIAKNYTNGAEKQDTLYKMVHSASGNHNYATNPQWANNIATLMLQVSGGSVNGGKVGTNGGVANKTSNNTGSSNATIQKVINAAKGVLNYPYQWGGESPAEGGFDCSGLMQYAYAQAGIKIPRVTYDQINFGTEVPLAGKFGNDNALPGDLLFPNNGHVYMYAGNGKALEAMDSAHGLGITDSPSRRKSIAIRRIVNQGTGTGRAVANMFDRTVNSQGDNNSKTRTVTPMVSLSQYTNMRNTDKNNVMLQVKNVMDEINESGETTNELLTEMLSLVNKMKDLKETNAYDDDPFEMSSELSSLFAGY